MSQVNVFFPFPVNAGINRYFSDIGNAAASVPRECGDKPV